MKLSDAIKLGAGFYIGYEILKGLDEGLGRAFSESNIGQKIIAKIYEHNGEPNESESEEKVIEGFHAE